MNFVLVATNCKAAAREIIDEFKTKIRKEKEYNNVYINKDLTEAERYNEYRLRQERKTKNDQLLKDDSNPTHRFFIRGGQVVKLKLKQ